MTRQMLTGNMAAAWGARLAAVDYVPAFPITPQTEIIETLAQWFGDGTMRGKFVSMDSEHAMLTAAGAAAATGVRVFTATSSQGLLYGFELPYTIAGWRVPLVLVNVSRALASPITLEPDHNDVLAARDSGFLQIHAETCQEAVDSILMAYRMAEDPRVLLPMLVNLDGFYLSFTREPVMLAAPEAVREFLQPYAPTHASFKASHPMAQGVRDALDILLAAGRLQPEDDVQVVVVAGDGSTYDMALSATSGTLYRQLDYWYICYDNEAYGNTGMQQSSATPYAARTATTAGDAGLTGGVPLGKKDIFEIWRAHTPPYIATVSPRHSVDLARKFEKAKQFKGPKLFLALAPCPTGWLYDPAKTQEYARLAVECGIFPLKEAVHGEVTHTYVRRRWRPVVEYLQGQGRFRHLFAPVRQEAVLRTMQEVVDRYWVSVKA
jgi:pyruvate/2-oxoacid:ferredoxin oxidoreductase beta subunit